MPKQPEDGGGVDVGLCPAGPPVSRLDVAWIDPPGDVDPEGSDHLFGRSGRAWREAGRADLGFRPDGCLVMTGHQAGPWHPGILAKHALLRAAADAGASTEDLLVEHDAGRPLAASIPVRDAAGRLHVRPVVWGDVPEDRAMMRIPPARPRRLSLNGLAVPAAARLEAWSSALAETGRTAPDVAQQVRAALTLVLPESVRPPSSWTGSERLLRTPFGRAMVAAMVDDPWACASAYAAALRRHPEVDMRPLHVRDDFVELPMWRIMDDGRRRRADDTDAAAWLEGGDDAPVLVPRALMLTAMARFGVADVFIHGRGGAAYDRVMARWIRTWVGARPAPAIVASADVRLDLGVGRASRTAASHRAERAVEAHRAWHDPEPPAEDQAAAGPGPVKRELLAAVNAEPRRSASRRRAWRRMHDQLGALRGVHVGRVEAASRRARDAERAHAAAVIADRRDWCAMLYEPGTLDELAAAVGCTPVARELAAVISATASAGRSGGPSRPTGGEAPSARSAPCESPPA